MNFVDSLNEYYNLKSVYDEQFVKEKKKIRDMIGNNNEKVNAFKKFKPLCISCKKQVGSIFSTSYNKENNTRVLKATCGSKTEPCYLNIVINLGHCYNVYDNINVFKNYLQEDKNDIVYDKNNLLFGYISTKTAVTNFEKLKESVDVFTYELNKNYEFIKSLDNETMQEKMQNLQKDCYLLINQIKEAIQGGGDIPYHDIVNIYITQLLPLLKQIQDLKYKVNYVELIQTPHNKQFSLIQQKNGIKDLEVFSILPKVERFDKGIKVYKNKK